MSCGMATFSLGLSASPYCFEPSDPDGACHDTGSLSPCEKNFRLPRILMNCSPGISVDVHLRALDGHRVRRLDVTGARRLHRDVLADRQRGVLVGLHLDLFGLDGERLLALEEHVAGLRLDGDLLVL